NMRLRSAGIRSACMRASKVHRAAAVVGLLMACGCGIRERPQPLDPYQFVRSRPTIGPNPVGQPVDQSGALSYGELHAPLLPDEYSNPNPRKPTHLSPLVTQAASESTQS